MYVPFILLDRCPEQGLPSPAWLSLNSSLPSSLPAFTRCSEHPKNPQRNENTDPRVSCVHPRPITNT